MPDLIAAAKDVAATCECVEDSSCFSCLRSNSSHELRWVDALQVLHGLCPDD